MGIEEILHQKRSEIRQIASRHGVLRMSVFGSVARGEARPDSDIDILVEAGPQTSSWFPAGLTMDLENLLGRRVEVVTTQGLHPDLRERVLREARPL